MPNPQPLQKTRVIEFGGFQLVWEPPTSKLIIYQMKNTVALIFICKSLEFPTKFLDLGPAVPLPPKRSPAVPQTHLAGIAPSQPRAAQIPRFLTAPTPSSRAPGPPL